MTSATSVGDLVQRNGDEFIDYAYQTLLGRAPDPAGQKHYRNILAQGAGKGSVLRQLAESKECLARKVNLAGLDTLIAEQKRARHWFWGTLSRSLRMEKQANRMEWQLGALVDTVQKLQLETGDRFAQLDGWVSQSGAAQRGKVHPSSQGVRAGDAAVAPLADTSSLSQPARQIFARLTQARSARETS